LTIQVVASSWTGHFHDFADLDVVDDRGVAFEGAVAGGLPAQDASHG
jgi:hypothetical protein